MIPVRTLWLQARARWQRLWLSSVVRLIYAHESLQPTKDRRGVAFTYSSRRINASEFWYLTDLRRDVRRASQVGCRDAANTTARSNTSISLVGFPIAGFVCCRWILSDTPRRMTIITQPNHSLDRMTRSAGAPWFHAGHPWRAPRHRSASRSTK